MTSKKQFDNDINNHTCHSLHQKHQTLQENHQIETNFRDKK